MISPTFGGGWPRLPPRRSTGSRPAGPRFRQRSRSARPLDAGQAGVTLIEVMVAALVLVSGLLALLAMGDVSNQTTATNRVRQESDSLAREVIANARELAYSPPASSTLATTLPPQLPGATASASNPPLARTGVPFQVPLPAC